TDMQPSGLLYDYTQKQYQNTCLNLPQLCGQSKTTAPVCLATWNPINGVCGAVEEMTCSFSPGISCSSPQPGIYCPPGYECDAKTNTCTLQLGQFCNVSNWPGDCASGSTCQYDGQAYVCCANTAGTACSSQSECCLGLSCLAGTCQTTPLVAAQNPLLTLSSLPNNLALNCGNAGIHTYGLSGVTASGQSQNAFFCSTPGLGSPAQPNQQPQCPSGYGALYEFETQSYLRNCIPLPTCGKPDPTYCISANNGQWVTAGSTNCANSCCTDSNASVLYCQALPTQAVDQQDCQNVQTFLEEFFQPAVGPALATAQYDVALKSYLTQYGKTSNDQFTFNGVTQYYGDVIPEYNAAPWALIAYLFDYDTLDNGSSGWISRPLNWFVNLPQEMGWTAGVDFAQASDCSATTPDALGSLTSELLFNDGAVNLTTGPGGATCASPGHCFMYDGSLFGNPNTAGVNAPAWPENFGHNWNFCNTAVIQQWLALTETVKSKMAALNTCISNYGTKGYTDGITACINAQVATMSEAEKHAATLPPESYMGQLIAALEKTFGSAAAFAAQAQGCCYNLYQITQNFKQNCAAPSGGTHANINTCQIQANEDGDGPIPTVWELQLTQNENSSAVCGNEDNDTGTPTACHCRTQFLSQAGVGYLPVGSYIDSSNACTYNPFTDELACSCGPNMTLCSLKPVQACTPWNSNGTLKCAN
ncbi:MAG TPA: hypothetical protein VJJ83_02020, partial [Candidatus Babeliales bacterium]|nr:hypothetical protein [Candidatus Babeliales bacterium]